MKYSILSCILLVFLSNSIRGDDSVLSKAISNVKRLEQLQLEDNKQIAYSTIESRNGKVYQRVDGFMVHQKGEALHRRVEERPQSTSSIVVNLNNAKYRAELNKDLRPKTPLPKAADDVGGDQFVIIDYVTDHQFHPGGLIHFAPMIASILPKYSLSTNYELWRSAGNKPEYTAPDSAAVDDKKFHKFVLKNWPQEHVPELTVWIDERMQIVKKSLKEEKFGFTDVVTIAETMNVDGFEFPVQFVSERTRGGDNPKSFKTEVKAKLTESLSQLPSEWFTIEHYGVSPRESPEFVSPPSNNWKFVVGAVALLVGIVATSLYLRRQRA